MVRTKSGCTRVKVRASFYSGYDFSEAELATIAATLGLSPGDGRYKLFCRDLREATRKYLVNRDAELQRPRAAKTRRSLQQFRRDLKTIQKAVKKFRAQFGALDEHASGILATVICAEAPELLDVVAAAPESLSRASNAIDRALRVIGPDPGGRTKCHVSLRRYVLELHALFQGITGRSAVLPSKVRGRFRGRFFRFCKTVLATIGDPIVEGGDDVPLVSQLKKVKIIKNKLSARKDFKTHPTLLEK